jgi:hypothetical protein
VVSAGTRGEAAEGRCGGARVAHAAWAPLARVQKGLRAGVYMTFRHRLNDCYWSNPVAWC